MKIEDYDWLTNDVKRAEVKKKYLKLAAESPEVSKLLVSCSMVELYKFRTFKIHEL
jgi:hypothetical protein